MNLSDLKPGDILLRMGSNYPAEIRFIEPVPGDPEADRIFLVYTGGPMRNRTAMYHRGEIGDKWL